MRSLQLTASTAKDNLTRDQLERMRNWIIHKSLPSITAGAIFEYLWPYLLLGPNAESCPQEAACYCQMFEVHFDQSDGGSEMANDSLHACYDIIDYRNKQIIRLLEIEGQRRIKTSSDNDMLEEIERIRIVLHDLDVQLNSTLGAALKCGREMYPLNFSSIQSIDIFSELMSY